MTKKTRKSLLILGALLSLFVLFVIIIISIRVLNPRTFQPSEDGAISRFTYGGLISYVDNYIAVEDESTIPHGHETPTVLDGIFGVEDTGGASLSGEPCDLFDTGIMDDDCDGIPNALEQNNLTDTNNPDNPYLQGDWDYDDDGIFHGMDGHYACDRYPTLLNCELNTTSAVEAITRTQDTDAGGVEDVIEIIYEMDPLDPADDCQLLNSCIETPEIDTEEVEDIEEEIEDTAIEELDFTEVEMENIVEQYQSIIQQLQNIIEQYFENLQEALNELLEQDSANVDISELEILIEELNEELETAEVTIETLDDLMEIIELEEIDIEVLESGDFSLILETIDIDPVEFFDGTNIDLETLELEVLESGAENPDFETILDVWISITLGDVISIQDTMALEVLQPSYTISGNNQNTAIIDRSASRCDMETNTATLVGQVYTNRSGVNLAVRYGSPEVTYANRPITPTFKVVPPHNYAVDFSVTIEGVEPNYEFEIVDSEILFAQEYYRYLGPYTCEYFNNEVSLEPQWCYFEDLETRSYSDGYTTEDECLGASEAYFGSLGQLAAPCYACSDIFMMEGAFAQFVDENVVFSQSGTGEGSITISAPFEVVTQDRINDVTIDLKFTNPYNPSDKGEVPGVYTGLNASVLQTLTPTIDGRNPNAIYVLELVDGDSGFVYDSHTIETDTTSLVIDTGSVTVNPDEYFGENEYTPNSDAPTPPDFVTGNTGFVPCGNGNTMADMCKYNDLIELINRGFEFAFYLVTPVAAVAVFWAGYLFITAQGNSDKLKKAKHAMTYVVVGIIILMAAWLMVATFLQLLGVDQSFIFLDLS